MKKGLSPLIATVLLIAFTIAIAGIVSTFVLDFSTSQSEQTSNKASQELECAYSGLFIKSASYNSTGDDFELTIRNNGREKLTDFKADILFDNNTKITAILTPANTTEMFPGDELTFETNGIFDTCTDINKIAFRSDTCPLDARDEIEEGAITSCS